MVRVTALKQPKSNEKYRGALLQATCYYLMTGDDRGLGRPIHSSSQTFILRSVDKLRISSHKNNNFLIYSIAWLFLTHDQYCDRIERSVALDNQL
jgi:hypothetical protein